jgi:hypothetical protein
MSLPIGRPPVVSSDRRWLRCSEPIIGCHGRARRPGRSAAIRTRGTGGRAENAAVVYIGHGTHRVPSGGLVSRGGIGVQTIRDYQHITTAVIDDLERP